MSKNMSRTPRQDPNKPTGKAPPAMFDSPPRLLPTRGAKQQPSMSDVMTAISSLTTRIDTMEASLAERVRCDMKSIMNEVEERVVAKCENHTVEAIKSYHTEVTSKLEAKLNRLVQDKESEEAKLSAVLHGVPESANRRSVDSMLKKIDSTYRSLRLFTNPKTSKTTGILVFANTDQRDSFVTKFRSEERMLVDGGMKHIVNLVSGKTKMQRERNMVLRAKRDELEKCGSSTEKWTIDWVKRSILLNGKIRFKQERTSTDVVEVRGRNL